MEIVAKLGRELNERSPVDRVAAVQEWLAEAQKLASQLAKLGFTPGGSTDIRHQQVWLEVFKKWRDYAKQ